MDKLEKDLKALGYNIISVDHEDVEPVYKYDRGGNLILKEHGYHKFTIKIMP